ncbi:MAG: hypothetical protein IK086_03780, partial [Clostridia bacterium]|nr:hypothetical protein [Clostridia bacterium]
MKKVMCIIVALIFAVSVCACGESKNKGNNAAFDDTGDEFFDISDDNGDTKSDSGESGTDVKKFGGGSNNTGDNGGDDNFTPVELYENKNFTPKSVPSRKNAYKLTNTMNKLKAGETLNVTYFGGSVTSGTGSTNASKNSWRALTTAFLKTLTNGKVEETN